MLPSSFCNLNGSAALPYHFTIKGASGWRKEPGSMAADKK